MEKLKNFEYLVGNFYTIDGNTMADGDLLNAEKLMGKDLKIDQSKGGPKVLIYHTHSQEAFADSTEAIPAPPSWGWALSLRPVKQYIRDRDFAPRRSV